MKMGHITIRTNKFLEEIAFYRDIVRLNIVRDLRGKGSNIVFLADHEDDTRIEVIEIDRAGESGNDRLSIGFHTEDIENFREELRKKGLAVSGMTSPVPAVHFFFVKDPAGVSVQFVEDKSGI